MESAYILVLMVVAVCGDGQPAQESTADPAANPNAKLGMLSNGLTDTELLMSFVVTTFTLE